eukprot:1161064-Pelagomonas_calceolata.AAC.5
MPLGPRTCVEGGRDRGFPNRECVCVCVQTQLQTSQRPTIALPLPSLHMHTATHLLRPRLERVILRGRLKRIHVAVHGGHQQIHAAIAIQVVGEHHAAAEEGMGRSTQVVPARHNDNKVEVETVELHNEVDGGLYNWGSQGTSEDESGVNEQVQALHQRGKQGEQSSKRKAIHDQRHGSIRSKEQNAAARGGQEACSSLRPAHPCKATCSCKRALATPANKTRNPCNNTDNTLQIHTRQCALAQIAVQHIRGGEEACH